MDDMVSALRDFVNILPVWAYGIWLLVSWAMAVWMVVSVLRSDSEDFRDLGRSKLWWFLLSLVAFVPYLGGIIVLVYFFKVRAHLPFPPPRPRPSPSSHEWRPSSRSTSSSSSTAAGNGWQPPRDTTCRQCGGSGYSGSCGCGNGWIHDDPYGGPRPCPNGCYYGRIRCSGCHGTGSAP